MRAIIPMDFFKVFLVMNEFDTEGLSILSMGEMMRDTEGNILFI